MKNNRRKTEVTLQDANLYDKVTHVETSILSKLVQLRKRNQNWICSHIQDLTDIQAHYVHTENYYFKFWKLYLTTELWKYKADIFGDQIQQIQNEIVKIQDMFQKRNNIRQQGNLPQKKTRRKADQVNRAHICKKQGCFKSYGTELALRLHIRQKHY